MYVYGLHCGETDISKLTKKHPREITRNLGGVFMLNLFNDDLESVKHLPKQAGITILSLFGLVVILPGVITSAAGGHPVLSLFDRLNAVGNVVVHLNRINHLARCPRIR